MMKTNINVEIKRVQSSRVRHLRHSELRKGQDFSTTSYQRDKQKDTIHMACIREDNIISCATFYPQNTDKLESINSYRLRGMATDSEFKRKGFGAMLMRQSLLLLKSKGADLIWCNSRLAALNFYKKLGFEVIGDIFNIKDIGPHYYMFKKI